MVPQRSENAMDVPAISRALSVKNIGETQHLCRLQSQQALFVRFSSIKNRRLIPTSGALPLPTHGTFEATNLLGGTLVSAADSTHQHTTASTECTTHNLSIDNCR
jgi:hypothetical protein